MKDQTSGDEGTYTFVGTAVRSDAVAYKDHDSI
jgi:hypothetical protein